jgi:hypothetical protein
MDQSAALKIVPKIFQICKVDAECISSLLTFEHLSSVGNEKAPASLPASTPIEKLTQNTQKYKIKTYL